MQLSSWICFFSLCATVISVTNDDFLALEAKLKEYIAKNPDDNIPLLVRNSFHDLFLQEKGGLHGCIVQPEFFREGENVGLDVTNTDIKNLVETNFPSAGFSYGDVIAFAGKVAIESALPCVNVDFKFNRASCDAKPRNKNRAPSAFIDRVDKYGPMLKYLGGTLNAEEIAILNMGGHGINGADALESGWKGSMSDVSSGKDYIAKTFASVWKEVKEGTLLQFFTGDAFDPKSSIIRLPSDLVFFPSKIPDGSKKDDSIEAKSIESKLKEFVDQDRSVFDNQFAQVYSKMLAIGGGGEQSFISNRQLGQCQDSKPPVSVQTTPAEPSKAETTSITRMLPQKPFKTQKTAVLPDSTQTPSVGMENKAGDFVCINDTQFKHFVSAKKFVIESCPPGFCATGNPPNTNPCIGKAPLKPQQTEAPPTLAPTIPGHPPIAQSTHSIGVLPPSTSSASGEPIKTQPTVTQSKACPPGKPECALSGSQMAIPHLEILLLLICKYLD